MNQHPVYLGFQLDWPVFVKTPFQTGKFNWKRLDHFPWSELGYEPDRVALLYQNGYIYHNPDLETQNEVGFRLHEFTATDLRRIVETLNQKVKERTDSKEQFNKIRCKMSTNPGKQRTLIRRFLYNNPTFEDDYYHVYDFIKSTKAKPIKIEEEVECGVTTTQTSELPQTAEDLTQSDS